MVFKGNCELAESLGLTNTNLDMHTHILPGFDDGPQAMIESIEIANEIRDKGCEAAIWTPHYNLSAFEEIDYQSIKKHYDEYSHQLEGETGLKLFYGAELYGRFPIPSQMISLGNSDFVLIEFPLDVYPLYLFDVIYNIQIAGYRVIMAHVERYLWLFPKKKKFLTTAIDYSVVEELKNKDVYFQVNYMTLLNLASYRFLLPLLKEKKIEFLGSDKHWLTDGRSVIDFDKLSTIEL